MRCLEGNTDHMMLAQVTRPPTRDPPTQWRRGRPAVQKRKTQKTKGNGWQLTVGWQPQWSRCGGTVPHPKTRACFANQAEYNSATPHLPCFRMLRSGLMVCCRTLHSCRMASSIFQNKLVLLLLLGFQQEGQEPNGRADLPTAAS